MLNHSTTTSTSLLRTPASRARPVSRSCRADALNATRTDPTTLKNKIKSLSGSKYGLDRSEDVKASVEGFAKQLMERGEVKQLDMTGTQWKTVYTNAKGTSSGKFGPFIGDVTQVFPADKKGQYLNKVDFNGVFKVDLLADYSSERPDRINVEFVHATFKLGPFSLTRAFPPGYKGHWALKYVDDDIRVFNSNMGSLFILRKA